MLIYHAYIDNTFMRLFFLQLNNDSSKNTPSLFPTVSLNNIHYLILYKDLCHFIHINIVNILQC